MALNEILAELATLELSALYERDFTAVEAKSDQELAAVFAVADALRELQEKNYATGLFAGGLALWEGPEEPGFAPFAAAASMLGLQAARVEVLDADVLVRSGADVICPRGELGQVCDRLYRSGAVSQRPLSLPRNSALALVLAALHAAGGVREMWGREVPLPGSIPDDLPGLFQRFGLTASPREMEETERWQAGRLERYILAAMVVLGKCPEPVKALDWLRQRGKPRRFV